MKQRITHPDLPSPSAGISAAVLCDGWLHVSGQGPLDMRDRSIIRGTIEEETQRTLENIAAIISEAGGTITDVVKCTCYLSDIANFPGFDKTYRSFFNGEVPPARTTTQAGLLNGILVEIDAIARIRGTEK